MRSVNNHIHTKYSFSPYSPSQAAFKAREAGLASAGIMDHDSVGGAFEFINACVEAGIASTVGFECRVSMKNTPFFDRRLNNPDQKGVAYVAMHGIPHQNIEKAEAFLAPYRAKRNERNRKMLVKINALLNPYGISLDFEKDILPLSNYPLGSVTERHLLFAAANAIIAYTGRGAKLLEFVENALGVSPSQKIKDFLSDESNNIVSYDLLGVLKSSWIEKIYIDADEECPDVCDFIKLCNSIGAISAYAYLGDVGNSVTGDKKAQTFEDSYIDELFDELKRIGFRAVTYMPSRNTLQQLKRVMTLCEKHGFFQISGEDINSPRQSFVCESLSRPEFAHLTDSTWALIGHEAAATENIDDAFFSEKSVKAYPSIKERTEHFKIIGLKGEKTV